MGSMKKRKRKGLILLAIICLSSSVLVRICVQGERLYHKYNVPYHQSSLPFQKKALRIPLNGTIDITDGRMCSTDDCHDSLSPVDVKSYRRCYGRLVPVNYQWSSGGSASCRFITDPGREPIALASFPGSGNTWLRGLLQLATGVCTGSLYCDKDLAKNGFRGEGIASGSVLVAKTHRHNDATVRRRNVESHDVDKSFVKAVFILRNPFDALISERNRNVLMKNRNSNVTNSIHISVIGMEHFGSNVQWVEFVNSKIKQWKAMINYWLVEWTKPVLVVTYEQMKNNTFNQIKRILHFLEYQVNENGLEVKIRHGFK
jgi:hypothetical protein